MLGCYFRKSCLPVKEALRGGCRQEKDRDIINLHGYCLHHQTEAMLLAQRL